MADRVDPIQCATPDKSGVWCTEQTIRLPDRKLVVWRVLGVLWPAFFLVGDLS